jgi:hypothetical protein
MGLHFGTINIGVVIFVVVIPIFVVRIVDIGAGIALLLFLVQKIIEEKRGTYKGFHPKLQINMYPVASNDQQNQLEQQRVYRGVDW